MENVTAKQAQKEYMREWRQANKDKVKTHTQRYWEKKARQMSENHNKVENSIDGEVKE